MDDPKINPSGLTNEHDSQPTDSNGNGNLPQQLEVQFSPDCMQSYNGSSHQPPDHYVVESQHEPLIAQQPVKYRSFVCSIIFSCFVFWFCGFIFGFIGFVLAMVGQKLAAKGEEINARKLARASCGVSIAGLIIGIILIIVAGALLGTYFNNCYNPNCSYGTYTDTWFSPRYPRVHCKYCCRYFDFDMCNEYGRYHDYEGCTVCCNYYNKPSCEQYGSYKDHNGCKKCCEQVNKNGCRYGWANDSNDCRSYCCDYHDITKCNTYGFYYTSGGCKQCCSSYNMTECSLYGTYYEANRCRGCCSYYNNTECSLRGSFYDSYGCKKCCSYYIDASSCPYGWKIDSNGCKACCYYGENSCNVK